MLSMSMIMKVFGIGVIGSIGTIVLRRMGKEDLAVLLDIALIIGVMGYVFFEVKDYIDRIIHTFGV